MSLHFRITWYIAPYLFGLHSPFNSKIGKFNFEISAHVVTGRPSGIRAVRILSKYICLRSAANFDHEPAPLRDSMKRWMPDSVSPAASAWARASRFALASATSLALSGLSGSSASRPLDRKSVVRERV